MSQTPSRCRVDPHDEPLPDFLRSYRADEISADSEGLETRAIYRPDSTQREPDLQTGIYYMTRTDTIAPAIGRYATVLPKADARFQTKATAGLPARPRQQHTQSEQPRAQVQRRTTHVPQGASHRQQDGVEQAQAKEQRRSAWMSRGAPPQSRQQPLRSVRAWASSNDLHAHRAQAASQREQRSQNQRGRLPISAQSSSLQPPRTSRAGPQLRRMASQAHSTLQSRPASRPAQQRYEREPAPRSLRRSQSIPPDAVVRAHWMAQHGEQWQRINTFNNAAGTYLQSLYTYADPDVCAIEESRVLALGEQLLATMPPASTNTQANARPLRESERRDYRSAKGLETYQAYYPTVVDAEIKERFAADIDNYEVRAHGWYRSQFGRNPESLMVIMRILRREGAEDVAQFSEKLDGRQKMRMVRSSSRAAESGRGRQARR